GEAEGFELPRDVGVSQAEEELHGPVGLRSDTQLSHGRLSFFRVIDEGGPFSSLRRGMAFRLADALGQPRRATARGRVAPRRGRRSGTPTAPGCRRGDAAAKSPGPGAASGS